MIIDIFDVRPHARCGLDDVADEREIDVVVRARIARNVHELNRQVDPLCRSVGAVRGHNVFFAQDRRASVDQEVGALIVIGQHAFADQDFLAGL